MRLGFRKGWWLAGIGAAQPGVVLAATGNGAVTLAEPGTLVLLGLGLLVIAGVRHWRNRGDRKLDDDEGASSQSAIGFNSRRVPPAVREDRARVAPSSAAPRTTEMRAETPDRPSDGQATPHS